MNAESNSNMDAICEKMRKGEPVGMMEAIAAIDYIENQKRENPLPWWRKDRLGWPIETFIGKPYKSALRIICQNIRKITG